MPLRSRFRVRIDDMSSTALQHMAFGGAAKQNGRISLVLIPGRSRVARRPWGGFACLRRTQSTPCLTAPEVRPPTGLRLQF